MKYLLNDGSGLPDREVGQKEAEKFIEERANPPAVRIALREGHTYTDQRGFSIRRKNPRKT